MQKSGNWELNNLFPLLENFHLWFIINAESNLVFTERKSYPLQSNSKKISSLMPTRGFDSLIDSLLSCFFIISHPIVFYYA